MASNMEVKWMGFRESILMQKARLNIPCTFKHLFEKPISQMDFSITANLHRNYTLSQVYPSKYKVCQKHSANYP